MSHLSDDDDREDHVPAKVAATKKKAKKKRSKKQHIMIFTNNHPLVKHVSDLLDWEDVEREDDWSVAWIDGRVIDKAWYRELRPMQRVNHFPGIEYLAKKKSLGRLLNAMKDKFPQDFTFYPKTWLLPEDAWELREYAGQKRNRTFICKPDASCQGKGIFLTRNIDDIDFGLNYVVQRYMHRPFLIDGLKFDLRIYVLITSCNPLRLYVMREGLVRFCTEKYNKPSKANIDNAFAHLTNYAINKFNENFVFNTDENSTDIGGKWAISALAAWMKQHGLNFDKLWKDIHQVIIKTMLAGHAAMCHHYRLFFPRTADANCCFQILGFDIMIDEDLDPWVIEVNRSPSLATDTPLDMRIKETAVRDAFLLVNPQPIDHRKGVKKIMEQATKNLSVKLSAKDLREQVAKQQQAAVKKIERTEDLEMGDYERVFPPPAPTPIDENCTDQAAISAYRAAVEAHKALLAHYEDMMAYSAMRWEEGFGVLRKPRNHSTDAAPTPIAPNNVPGSALAAMSSKPAPPVKSKSSNNIVPTPKSLQSPSAQSSNSRSVSRHQAPSSPTESKLEAPKLPAAAVLSDGPDRLSHRPASGHFTARTQSDVALSADPKHEIGSAIDDQEISSHLASLSMHDSFDASKSYDSHTSDVVSQPQPQPHTHALSAHRSDPAFTNRHTQQTFQDFRQQVTQAPKPLSSQLSQKQQHSSRVQHHDEPPVQQRSFPSPALPAANSSDRRGPTVIEFGSHDDDIAASHQGAADNFRSRSGARVRSAVRIGAPTQVVQMPSEVSQPFVMPNALDHLDSSSAAQLQTQLSMLSHAGANGMPYAGRPPIPSTLSQLQAQHQLHLMQPQKRTLQQVSYPGTRASNTNTSMLSINGFNSLQSQSQLPSRMGSQIAPKPPSNGVPRPISGNRRMGVEAEPVSLSALRLMTANANSNSKANNQATLTSIDRAASPVQSLSSRALAVDSIKRLYAEEISRRKSNGISRGPK